MEYSEKREFVEELIDNLRVDLLEKLDKMPEHWDGKQMRRYLEDYVKTNINYFRMDKKEIQEYENDVLIHNL